MADKAALLTILAGDQCPVCGGLKLRQQWTCTECYRPHQKTPEHQALSGSCDTHMAAAEAFLRMAKRALKPESD